MIIQSGIRHKFTHKEEDQGLTVEILESVSSRLIELIQHVKLFLNIEFKKEDFILDYSSLAATSGLMGQATYFLHKEEKIISLNIRYLLNDTECYLWDTFIHEFAHHVVRYFSVKNGEAYLDHGKEFMNVCGSLGLRGSATSEGWDKECSEYKLRKRNKHLPFYFHQERKK